MHNFVYSTCELSSINLAVFDQDDTLYSYSHGLKELILNNCLLSEAVSQSVNYDADDLGGTLFRLDDKGQDEMTRLFRKNKFSMDRIAERYATLDISSLKPCLETIKLLSKISCKKIVCTDSPDIHAERVLEQLNKTHLFDEVCTGTSRGFMFKPFNGVYIGILERHKVDAKNVLFVEDSPINLKPAKELGMMTVLVGPKWQDVFEYVDYAYPDVLTFLRHCEIDGVNLANL